MEKLYDITEVCAMLATTSRTLRYYEAHGLIHSTTTPPSRRRHYTDAQLHEIKSVLALRSLGLPLKAIRSLPQNGTTLEDAILSHRAELIACINEKQRQINLLEEVLHSLRTGQAEPGAAVHTDLYQSEAQLEAAARCTDALLREDYAACEACFSEDMRILLPPEALGRSWEIALEPAGAFRSTGKLSRLDPPNMVLQTLHYERRTVRVRYVFHGEEICGLWTDYAPEAAK